MTQAASRKSRSKRKHADRRATHHRKKAKIQQRRDALARKAATSAGKAWNGDHSLLEASRWREEADEAQSIIDGTHPKLIGLEDEQLERRRKLFERKNINLYQSGTQIIPTYHVCTQTVPNH